jgi:iron-sulfur cluster assembly accessory protein
MTARIELFIDFEWVGRYRGNWRPAHAGGKRRQGEVMENIQSQGQGESPAGGAEEYHPVTLTPKAAEMVRITREQEEIDSSQGLRVAVRGGGCSGFEYALDFEGEARPNDYVYDQHGLTLYVDAVSARYLEGTTVDYVLGMSGAGFKFLNPRAAGTCGCGSSFTV